MGYTKVFTKPYAEWHDLPTKNTPVTAEVMEEYDEAIQSIENHLDGSTAIKPVSKTSAMTQQVGVDNAGALFTEPYTPSGGNVFTDLTVGERKESTTTGTNSVAEGYKNEASGNYTHAEGYQTQALANNCHAEGYQTLSGGKDSFGGYGTCSHAEGYQTKALANNSHVEGNGCETAKDTFNNHAEGNHTIAGYDNQSVCGKYNNNKSGDLFEVGNGSSNNNRSNAFEVDANGNIAMGGNINTADATTLSDSDYVYVSISGVIKKITISNLKTVLGIN